ncbi:unnamed protein product [Enterobius vermicularis]|uniref:MSP domain-containing protein n=1 Tax=Enterobius vermicularis TaxID=51028 RepID=A0A158Q9U9_ENTVE|nr:unnamed protein product [Enterobius vermicularis]
MLTSVETTNRNAIRARLNSVPIRDGFAYVGGESKFLNPKKRIIYLLESPIFSLKDDSVLTFDVYKRTNSISLKVCINNITNCVYEVPRSNKQIFWRRSEIITLPKYSRKVTTFLLIVYTSFCVLRSFQVF